MVSPVLLALVLASPQPPAIAPTIARGVVVDPVQCLDAADQSYALYLPSQYTAERGWSLLLAFHPAARGRHMAERYQAAAERYGYIVAASNNARNGPHAISAAAAQAMGADVSRRFSIDPKRIYLAGMSGGARVALGLAMANQAVAGVVASSAGYPDSRPRKHVTFAVFGTAGHEDFNYLEMREMDRALTSPHFLAIFSGGHVLPPDEVALEAVEWLEIDAMRSGRRDKDEALARAILEKRRARIAGSAAVSGTVYLLEALVRDFTGVLDVTAETARLAEMRRRGDVRRALERDRDFDEDEARKRDEILALEAQLADESRRTVALTTLNERVGKLAKQAAGEAETPERSQARRLLRSIAAAVRGRVTDRDYLALLERHAVVRP